MWRVDIPYHEEVSAALVPLSYDHPDPAIEAKLFGDDVPRSYRGQSHTVPEEVYRASRGGVVHPTKVVCRWWRCSRTLAGCAAAAAPASPW